MFKSTDVVEDPRDTKISMVRVVGDLEWAKNTYFWIKSTGFDCDLPLPAIWETDQHFKVFGYQIKVREYRETIIQTLRLH